MNMQGIRFALTDEEIARLPAAGDLVNLRRELAAAAIPVDKLPERRKHPRFPFKTNQLLAPYDGQKMPALEEFHSIRCHDISAGGFSYLAELPPQHKNVIVGIRWDKDVRWLKARVLHDTLGIFDGQHKYLIGCEFVERIEN